jgi:uncharacterized protein (DUF2147 family)
VNCHGAVGATNYDEEVLMKHHAIAAALGLLTTMLVAPAFPSQAAGLDPSGIWLKDDGMAKMEVKKCGKGGLCCKIVWLKEPNDSRGKPLHDVRNEDPSMRDRPIIGLPLFSNLSPAEPNTWVGNVYNPEEGHIYTEVKVTMASRQQLVLRGCKAWLLCGEKVWTRSTLPAPESGLQEAKASGASAPKEPAVEAAAEPQEMPQTIAAHEALGPNEPAVETAAQEPEVKAPASLGPQAPTMEAAGGGADPPPVPTHKSLAGASVPAKVQVQATAAGEAEDTQTLPISRGTAAPVMRPVLPLPSQDAAAGYGFMLTTATPESAPPFSSEKVSTMFVHPLGSATASNAPVKDVAVERQARAAGGSPIALPNQRPKLKATPQAAKPQIVKPQTTRAADASDPPAVTAKPKPKPKPVVKKPEEDLPWLRHP